MLQMLVV